MSPDEAIQMRYDQFAEVSGCALREMDDGMRTAVRCAREVVEVHDPCRSGLIHNLRRLEKFVDWYAAFEARSSLEDSIPAAVSGPQPSSARLSPTPVEEA